MNSLIHENLQLYYTQNSRTRAVLSDAFKCDTQMNFFLVGVIYLCRGYSQCTRIENWKPDKQTKRKKKSLFGFKQNQPKPKWG